METYGAARNVVRAARIDVRHKVDSAYPRLFRRLASVETRKSARQGLRIAKLPFPDPQRSLFSPGRKPRPEERERLQLRSGAVVRRGTRGGMYALGIGIVVRTVHRRLDPVARHGQRFHVARQHQEGTRLWRRARGRSGRRALAAMAARPERHVPMGAVDQRRRSRERGRPIGSENELPIRNPSIRPPRRDASHGAVGDCSINGAITASVTPCRATTRP